MAVTQVVPDLLQISGAGVHAYAIVTDDGITLVDTGVSGRGADRISAALRGIERTLGEVRHILVTHYHPDHVGGLSSLDEARGATVYAHPLDARAMRRGGSLPRGESATLRTRMLTRLLVRKLEIEAVRVDRELVDGETLPIAGGLRVAHTPGHTPGHTAYLWTPRGVLFVGDAASGFRPRPGWAFMYEDLEDARRSIRKLAEFEFDVAVFGHGRVLAGRANAAFRRFVESWAD